MYRALASEGLKLEKRAWATAAFYKKKGSLEGNFSKTKNCTKKLKTYS